MKKWKIILAIILALLIIPVGVGAIYVNVILNKVTVSEEEFDKDFDLNVNTSLENNNMKNIALFGLDCRTTDYKGCRSDVIMLISYHKKNNQLTVTSVARDAYVDIVGKGLDKLNHAYSYGGPQLAVQTLNRNLDLNIEDYVTVDFWSVEAIIDAIGGVEVDVQPEEVYLVNAGVEEANREDKNGKVVSNISNSGKQVLTGRQAVAYMRIRYVGNGDFERMERQRYVIQNALNQINNLSLNQMLNLVEELISMVKTNMSKGEIIELLTSIVTKGIPVMQQSQFPMSNHAQGMKIDGIYYYVPINLLQNVEMYHSLIYPEMSYEPSDNLKEINNKIEKAIQ